MPQESVTKSYGAMKVEEGQGLNLNPKIIDRTFRLPCNLKPIDPICTIICIRPLIIDKHLRLVMAHIALYCTWQSWAINIDRRAPKYCSWPLTLKIIDPWPLTLNKGNSDVKTRFLAFDLDLWPTTLTYNPNLAKVKVNLHTKYQGRFSR